jgi:predicted aminopeptidase
MKRVFLVLLGLLALALVAFIAMPTGRYLIRGAWEGGRILARRKSIAKMLADSTVPTVVRERLQLVDDARRFAIDSLGLKAGESFTTYSTVTRDTLVLVLTAAYRDRLEAVRWWFPIVGWVPYKGFFDFDAAKRARADLDAKGFDTILGASPAFSTLGWFNDPLLSTVLRSDPTYLANTVIHELTHNTLFVPSQVEFNESLASFVGARGAAMFFRTRGSDSLAAQVDAEWEDDKHMSAFWRMLTKRINAAFAALPNDSAARVRARDTVYAEARRVLVDSIAPLLTTIPKARLARMPLNNAVMLARRAYAHDLDTFDAVLRHEGGDLRATLARIREVTLHAKDPFAAMGSWLGGQDRR